MFVLMLMGIGGFVLVGYGQGLLEEVEVKKLKHNTRVLNEAKQALLQYAYNYPQFNSEGPGRLPCPAPDNTGLTGALTLALCQSVGRLPWAESEMNFYDARDADGEQLWYAVSENFYNLGGGGIINSDSDGTITLVDQTENIIYDGNGAGIAAVIIAPGTELAGQNRNGGPNDPANFLDSFNGFDNAVFNNGESDTNDDGFILGPVFDQGQNINAINDQMIVITAAEVIEMAEKATLQAYRAALEDYDQRIDNDIGAGDHYPWLFNYAVNEYGGGYPELDEYPSEPLFATEVANYLGNQGRVPSIFTDIFTEVNSQPIESELELDFTLTYPISPTTVGYDQVTPGVATGNFQFNNAVQHSFTGISTLPQTVSFSDIADVVGDDGRLSVTAITNQLFQLELWFWDEEELGPATGIWTICPAGGDALSDCNRDALGNPTPGSPGNLAGVEALRVIAEIDFSGTVDFDLDYNNDPVITVTSAAGAGNHATIEAVFLGTDVINLPVTLRYEIDRHYLNTFDDNETGTLEITDLNLSNVTLGLRFYPQLPAWASSNGWDDSILMAYASDYLPGGGGGPCTAGTDCLQINNIAGNNDNKIAILTIAGQHDWDDNGVAGVVDDVGDVFDLENEDLDDVFDVRAVNGNDKILVMDEL